ncbi:hypothetical protein [Actinoplanes sp. NPDC026623]|uniref:hypothetical protein n=1 Tax=Actinoplanes sp. NPDC026623 TaxID=3155610 RepID=UPI003401FE83
MASTGFGKSAVYQVPAVLMDGPTVIVSPLLALQRDQTRALAGHGAPDAHAVNSANSAGANSEAFEADLGVGGVDQPVGGDRGPVSHRQRRGQQ